MKLHELKPAKGAKKAAKRKGLGTGSGLGKTAGRGHKGRNSRSGGGVRLTFEGGQMPLHQRIPKRGFTSNKTVCGNQRPHLNRFEDNTVVTPEFKEAD